MIVSPLLFWVRFENSMMCFKFKRSCVWKTHSNKTNSTSVDRGKVDDNGDPFGVGFHKLEICRHRCSRNDMAVEQNQRKSNKPYTRNVEMSPFLWRIPAKVPGPTFQGNMCFLPWQFIMISFHGPQKMMWFFATSPRGDLGVFPPTCLPTHFLQICEIQQGTDAEQTSVFLLAAGSIRWSDSLRRFGDWKMSSAWSRNRLVGWSEWRISCLDS